MASFIAYEVTEPTEHFVRFGDPNWEEPESDSLYGRVVVDMYEDNKHFPWYRRLILYARNEAEGLALMEAMLKKLRS